MEAADGGGGSSRGFWEPPVFLYSAAFLSLGLFLAHKVHQGIRKQAAGEEAGGSQGLVSGPAQDGISQGTGRRSIRYLLCDNMKCSLCARVAEEATNVGCPLGPGLPFSASPQPPVLPAICDVEPSSWLGLSLPTGQGNFPQSISEPARIGGHSCLPLRDTSTGYLVGSLPEKQRAPFPPSSADWVWSQVTLSSSFSSLSEVSASSCTRGSSSSARPQGLFRTVILQEVVCEYCSQTDSEVTSESSGQKRVSPERDRPFPSICQGAAPDRHDEQGGQKEEPVFLGTCTCQRAGSGAVDSPFTAEAVRARLEWHLLARRVQHEMGLPLVLLRSLRAFIPPAPASTSERAARTFAAAPRPQALLFFSEDSKRELEQHLEKMVQLRRWGLPQRVQEALRHMTPGSRPTGHSAAPEDPGTEGARQTAPLCNDNVAFLSAPVFHPKFPAAQKTRRVEDRKWPIAEPVPPGRSDVQPSRGLTFQRKASNIQLRPKCRPFQAVPPTQVVNKDPTLPLQMHPTPQGGDTPFTAPLDWGRLEHHVLRKRFQHHWGLPSLVQRSLHHFFTAAPPPAPHLTPGLLPFQLEVKVSLSASQFRFIPGEAQRQLDGHIRSRVTERRWGLPKRAARSLHPFMPVSPPRTKVPKEGEKGHVSPTAKRSLSAKTPTRSKRCAGLSEGEPLPSGWPLMKHQAVRRHLTKKALEIQLGWFCPLVQRSQETFSRGRKRALPQIAHPGPRVVQPRCPEVPFVEQIHLDRIKLNIVHKNLAHRWGLPTLYKKSLAHLFHGTVPPVLHFLSPTTAAGVDFPAVEFISQQTREELEWHVRRKHLQHIWGLPGLVQRSLRHLLPATLLLPPPRIAPEKLMVSQQPLSFLSKETQQKLDLNVRKRVILQHWGLPQVVLRALRSLCPEEEFPPLGRRAAQSPLALMPCGSFPCSPSVGTFPGADDSPAGRGVAAAPHQAPVCPTARPREVEMIAHHVARKSVEVRLGIFPAVARQSWRLAWLSTRQHLPQLIHRGRGALRPRRGFLPFARVEDVDRIELAVSRNHFSSLWGLGLHYVEALVAMVPNPPTSWPAPRRPCMEFQEMPTPFLPRQGREALELSIRKKSLQHEWSLPLLIQKSLRALTEGLPMLPAPSRAEICVSVLPQELPFLPPSILSHLELHVQKMKLHRQWGLPRRVLQSVRGLRPQSGSHVHRQHVAQSPLALANCSHCMHQAASATGALSTRHSTQRAGKMAAVAALGHYPPPSMLGPRDLEQLRLHVARKCVEVRLGAFPALSRWSWRQAAFKQPLPKLLLPSHNLLQPRSHFLPFARREDLNQIELAVWHNRLRSLWGLGTLYVEAVAGLAPKLLPRSLTPSTAPFVFSEAKTPFLPEQDREAIDLLVRRRRLQHLWGLPGLIQRALAAFMSEAPSAPACPKTQILVQTHGGELFFVPPDLCRTLELHIQKMKIQRRWGLPSRVLKSLKMFLPTDSLGKMGSESRLPRSPPPPDQASPSSEGSLRPGSGHRKEGGHPSQVVLPRSPVPCHPALHIHLVTRGTRPPPPVGKKDVPGGGRPLGAVQLQGKGREEQACPLWFLLRAGAGPSNPKKSINKKLSLIGSILEKKLHLDHGLHTWLRDREWQRGVWKERGRKGGLRGADHAELRRDTGPGGPGRWEEGQVAGSAIRASEKAQGLRAAHTPKAQPAQAGRRESLVRLRGDSTGSPASGKPSRGIPQEKSCSVALDRICSRGRGMVPTSKGRKPASVNRERREQRPSSRERRPGIKEWRLSGKEQSEGQTLSCKEQRPGSKEETRPGSEEGRLASEEGSPGSKKEGRPGSEEGRPGSLEKRLASEEGRPDSKKEGRPGSLEKRPASEDRRPGSGVHRSRSGEPRSRSTERALSGKRPSSKEQRSSNTKHRNTAGHPKPPPPCLVKSRPEPPQRARLQQGGLSSSKAKPEQWSGPWAAGRGSLANVLTSGHSEPSVRKGGKSIKRHILHPEHPEHQMTKTEAASGSGGISLGPER